MNTILKVYCDSGADISGLKDLTEHLDHYQFPYDSGHRPKKRPKLAVPSAAQWQDCHITWGEAEFAPEEAAKSDVYSEIAQIIGPSNRRDILHIDSACKAQCQMLITADKRDIWSKRYLLEPLCNMKIFHLPSEILLLREYIIQATQDQ